MNVERTEQALATPDLLAERQAGIYFDLGRAHQLAGDVDRARSAFESVQQLESDLKVAGVRVRTRIHLGVQHAFMNDTRPDVYDAQAAARAWSDSLAFFRAELS